MKIKKPKGEKKCVVKRKLKLEGYKHCLEATQFKNKTNHLTKSNLNVDNLRQNHKEFMKIATTNIKNPTKIQK